MDDKIHFIFNMYDVSKDKSVSKQELATLLNQVPKELLVQQTRGSNGENNGENVGIDSESIDLLNDNNTGNNHEPTTPIDI